MLHSMRGKELAMTYRLSSNNDDVQSILKTEVNMSF